MNNNNSNAIRNIAAIGIGAAVYFILARFLVIPSPIPNTNIQTSYAFLALMGFLFGPFVGASVGLIGHFFTDLLSFGPWFSWIIATGFFGFAIGLVGRKIGVEDFNKKKATMFIVASLVIATITWGVVAPALDILIYAEPASKVFLQGLWAGISNGVVTAVLGTILIFAFSKSMVKSGSLEKE